MTDGVNDFEWTKDIILVNIYFQSHGINKPERYKARDSPNTTIEIFKIHLKKSKGIMGKLSLEKNGPELDPHSSLKENGIRDGSQLFLKSFTPRRKFISHRIQVQISNANMDPIKLNVSSQAHIYDLAHMLQDECGMPVDEQAWFKGDILLKNKNSLAVAMDDQRSRTRELRVKWLPKVQIGTHSPVQTADPRFAQNGMIVSVLIYSSGYYWLYITLQLPLHMYHLYLSLQMVRRVYLCHWLCS